MYSCAEVARWIASDEYKSGGFLRRLAIRLHLLLCTHCSRYLRQLEALAAAVQKLSRDIPSSEIESMKMRLLDQLAPKS